MTEEVNKTEAGAGGEPAETIESLKSRLAELESTVTTLNGEAAKHKSLRRQAEKERDDLKKHKPSESSGEDYKTLWKEANDKLSKTLERAKKADVNVALTEQLTKAKVAGDKVTAAFKLVDSALIEWDENSGVDSQSVVAAVQKLKSEHGFLFETTVKANTDVKKPGDVGSKNTITRTEFDSLSPMGKAEKVKAKVQIID